MLEGRISSSVLTGLAPFMTSAGLDFAAICTNLGIDIQAKLDDPDGYVDLSDFMSLLEIGARQSGNDVFGLQFAEKHQAEARELVYFIVANSLTLRDAFRARQRYSNLVASGYHFRFEEGSQSSKCSWVFASDAPPHNQFSDYVVTLNVQRVRQLLGVRWYPLNVTIEHPAPETKSEFYRVFGDNVHFDGPPTSMRIDSDSLASTVPGANRDLLRELERFANMLLSEQQPTIVEQVSSRVSQMLPMGIPTVSEVAVELGMSPRTLQRRLSSHSTNFRDILESTQIKLARHLLQQTDLPLMRVAFLLGFSEASSFSRAARNWLGQSASDFRSSRLRQ